MKKFSQQGFTLAEALIAIAIIGVVSATLLPLINKFMPDKNKILFLNTYDAIVEASQEMASNTGLYPVLNNPETDRVIYKSYPIANTTSVTLEGKDYSGIAKYCKLLALSFNSSAPTCSEGNLPADASWSQAPSFVAQNGVEFWVYSEKTQSSSNMTYESDIYIDVNGKGNKPDCQYAASSCKNPDRFKIMVASDGKVVVSDLKAQTYLNTRSNWRLNRDETETGTLLSALPAGDKTKSLELVPEESGGGSKPVLPTGQSYADWVTPAGLFKTYAHGVYAEHHNPAMPAGNYSNQRHYYWNQEAQSWVLLEGVYRVGSSSYNFDAYTGADADAISNQFSVGW